MNSQNHSILFTLLPLEVRQALFGYLIPQAVHVSLQRDGKVRVSTCVDNAGNNDLEGNERRATGLLSTDKIWARRLSSSWGPHWKCEELALRPASGNGSSIDDSADSCAKMLPMLSVCKRMQGEVLYLIGNTARVNVTDLETLNYLARGHLKGSLWDIKGLSPRNRDITLRLPIAFFKAIEEWYSQSYSGTTQDPRPESDASLSKEEKRIMLWIEVRPILIPQLEGQKNPSVIQLWLDHDEPFSWTAVNERATLSALIDSVSPYQATISEAFPLNSVNLPLLHPRWERPECHFTHGMPPRASKRWTITRRLRQRSRANGDHVDYSGDFPVMLDLLDPDFGASYTTREKLEADERSWWQRGDNVYQDMMDMGGGFFGADSTDTFEGPRAEQRRRALYPASYR